MQRRRCAAVVAALLAPAMLATVNCACSFAYTPNDPAVRGMIDRGLSFLETAKDRRTGGMAVVALALLKADKPADHPQIVKTVEMIQLQIQRSGSPQQRWGTGIYDVYSLGTSTIFLLSLDPYTYRNEIDFLLEALYVRQKNHGGWGYQSRATGDTSMTQYAVLSLWEAHQAGFQVPPRVLEAVAGWLLRTQDPSGAYSYQGQVSPTFQPIRQKQSEIRLSMAAAGLGSLYVCSDLLGYGRKNEEIPALKKIGRPDKPDAAVDVYARWAKNLESKEGSLLRRAQRRGNHWIAANFAIAPNNVSYEHYYLYALERYASFRELDEGKADSEEGPPWYNAGVEYLMYTQSPDGSWQSGVNKPIDTAFALLFLLRSAQQSIQHKSGFGPGTLVGGRGFPKGGEIVIRNGRAVAQPLAAPLELLRAALDNPEAADLAAAVEHLDELRPRQSEVLVNQYARQLRALLADRSPEKRIAAVKLLAASGNIENAPLLILALDDEDAGVVLQARGCLRRLARKIGGFGLPDEFNTAERRQAIRKWRAWYKQLQPDAEF